MRGYGFLGLSILALALALAVGLLLRQAVALSSLITVSEQVSHWQPIAGGLHLAAIGLLAVSWPRGVGWLHRRGRIDEVGRARLLALRWRVIAWLVVIELILGPTPLPAAPASMPCVTELPMTGGQGSGFACGISGIDGSRA